MTILEHGYKINELFRRINNLVRVGCVIDVDYSAAKARVQIGSLTTAYLPWMIPSTSAWIPLKVGEQVVVLSPNGDMAMGIILPALYHSGCPAPSSDASTISIVADIEQTGNQTITGALETSGEITAGADITASGEVTGNGIALSTHTHQFSYSAGVVPATAVTLTPE